MIVLSLGESSALIFRSVHYRGCLVLSTILGGLIFLAELILALLIPGGLIYLWFKYREQISELWRWFLKLFRSKEDGYVLGDYPWVVPNDDQNP